jgi:hypothetical protein
LRQARSKIFLQMGLDSPNQIDPVQQNGAVAHADFVAHSPDGSE